MTEQDMIDVLEGAMAMWLVSPEKRDVNIEGWTRAGFLMETRSDLEAAMRIAEEATPTYFPSPVKVAGYLRKAKGDRLSKERQMDQMSVDPGERVLPGEFESMAARFVQQHHEQLERAGELRAGAPKRPGEVFNVADYEKWADTCGVMADWCMAKSRGENPPQPRLKNTLDPMLRLQAQDSEKEHERQRHNARIEALAGE